MSFEGEGLRRVDDDLGCPVLVGYVYRSGPVLIEEERIGAHKLLALLPLKTPPLPSPPSALTGEDDGSGERESCEQAGGPGCAL